MAWTDDDLAAIDRVIAKGELRVDFRDRSVTYRSMDDLLKARAAIAGSLNAESETPRPRQYLTHSSQGW